MAKRSAATNENTGPKVDAGDSGATIGAVGDVSAAEASNARVQERVDKETEQGFIGVSVSPDDNDAFTFQARAEGRQPESEVRDTFTAVSQHAAAPANAGEVHEASKSDKG